MNNHSSVPPALFEAKQFQIQTSSKSKKGTRVMTVLSRKTKTASLAMVAIAAFAIAAPQARAELPQGYEQLLYIETYEGGGQCIATGDRQDRQAGRDREDPQRARREPSRRQDA